MSEAHRDAITRRIRALLAKTVENGATEDEALAAAEKAAELMDRYRLGMSDVEIAAEPVIDINVDRSRRQTVSAADYCLRGIQRYCGVRTWTQPVRENGAWVRRIRILGLKADAEMAQYLYEMITNVIRAADSAYFATLPHGRQHAAYVRRACASFQVGMASRINERLVELAEARDNTARTGSGTALVVVKRPLVANALAALQTREGWQFRTRGGGIGVRDRDAYLDGRAKGETVSFDRPVGADAGRQQLN